MGESSDRTRERAGSQSSRETSRLSRYQSLEALRKRFDEHVGDWALTLLTSTLSLYVMGPEVKSALRVLADPRLPPFYPYPLEKRRLERKITSEGRQLDVGNRTDDQAIREMPDQTPDAASPNCGWR
jgi:hypothetical protein